MSASSMILVAASIVAIDGGRATIDVGETGLLEVGDRGQAFYQLMVNGSPERIEVGHVTVVDANAESARVVSDSGASLRTGFQVEFRVPESRRGTAEGSAPGSRAGADQPESSPIESETRLAEADEPDDVQKVPVSRPLRDIPPSPPSQDRPQPVPDDYPDQTLPAVPVDPDPDESVPADSGEQESIDPADTGAAVEDPIEPPDEGFESKSDGREMLEIAAGRYPIGLDPAAAQFFNQTPRHDVVLAVFAIDRVAVRSRPHRPLDDSALTGLGFSEAQTHCQELGLRLPTEQEWEVAAQTPGFETHAGLFEWTSSWYRAYPGNRHPEEAYRSAFRVLRGSENGSRDSVFVRRFMDPGDSHSQVGFRCVSQVD